MSRHYDNPLRISYNLGEIDFGAGDSAFAVKVPPGVSRCRIEEIHNAVTETFTDDTTEGAVHIGTASDPDKFAALSMGTAAATDGYGIRDVGEETVLKDNNYGGRGIVDVSANGEDIDQLEVATIAPTGGTPAGKAHVTLALAWW